MDGKVSQFDLLSKVLHVANLRQRILAQNIANVNTPQYQRLEVSFEDAFRRQMVKQQEKSAIAVAPRIMEAGGGAERVDGNNVDIDDELGRLTKNTVLMSAVTQILASRIAAHRSAISGR
jgi:flagellar basal-body rod protein FlgB